MIIYYNMAYSKSLAEGIRQYKETEEGRDHMSEAVEEYGDKREKRGEKRGYRIGKLKEDIRSIRALGETVDMTPVQAMDALGIKDNKERQAITKVLEYIG